jgi:hypothetical protein
MKGFFFGIVGEEVEERERERESVDTDFTGGLIDTR